MIKAIIFDYNGVLANDEPLHFQAFKSVLKKYDVRLSQPVYDKFCLGRTDQDGFIDLKNEFQDILQDTNIADLLTQKSDTYQQLLADQNILYSGAKEIIISLANKFRLAIVTSSTLQEVTAVLKKHHLMEKFEVIVTADDISTGKPNPEGYLLAISKLHLPKSDVVIIEDAPSGIAAAKNAGVFCVAVQQTFSDETLKEADVVIPSIRSITSDFINRLDGS